MIIEETNLTDVKIIIPQIHEDTRGFFLESYNKKKFKESGIDFDFVQDNHSRSKKNVLRGLHFQKKNKQGKLVRCTSGVVYDVAVDINKNSDTFGNYFGIELSEHNKKMLWIPPGYAHGFCVLSEYAEFQYKCTDFYDPNDEGGLLWSDKNLDISWPITNPIVSLKDQKNMELDQL